KTDLFTPIIRRVQEMAGHSEAEVERNIVAYRVIADHARAVTFLIGDGVLPGSEGRNYVLRMILRRAVRFGRELGFDQPFLAEVAKTVIKVMGEAFPELVNRRAFILNTVTQEEQRFLRTLDQGLARLHEVMDKLSARDETVIPGEEAFHLYDTLGLPLEITRDVAEEQDFTIDETGYQAALEAQRQRAREADTFVMDDEDTVARYQHTLLDLQERALLGESGVRHDPYTAMELDTQVAAVLQDAESVEQVQEGDRVAVVLRETCFYVEAGGQVADTGFIRSLPGSAELAWSVRVDDVREPVPGLIVHVGEVESGHPEAGDPVVAAVDRQRRLDIARNHTATHLLQRALRRTLGEHVQQAGSLVAPERLRFDFTHPATLTPGELQEVTARVNEAILANYPVQSLEMPYREAIEQGVIALFGEKYGDVVRVLRVGDPEEPFSRELCGGTHVSETGELGCLLIVSQESVGAGVRRIEAVTGRGAVDFVERQLQVLERTAAHLGVPPQDLERRVEELLDDLQTAQGEIDGLQRRLARLEFESLLERVDTVAGTSLLAARVDVPDVEALREMTDWFRDRVGSGVFILGTVVDGRPALVASVTRDVVQRGADAADLVRRMGRVMGGGGGGRPSMAQAGGSDPAKLEEALDQARVILEEQLKG
ncbi:MAG: alanine--tRNA ligase, partial [Chloroflexota bacterium]